jgi:Domain of unknown function (DUF4440)
MRKLLASFLLTLSFAIGLQAQTAPDAAELTKLLNDFLAGASKNDAAMHDRFWAEDLIYTGSVGRRVGKADIMADVRKSPTISAGPAMRYSAEEIRIQQYGNTAIVAFRLVGTVDRGKTIEITKFLNTGTFLKRNGKWQVVAWQATRLPRPEETAKREVAAAEIEFHQALLSANTETLDFLLHESFVWTRSTGEQVNRQQLLDDLKAARLKYSKVDNTNVTVSISGETAIVRGVSTRQRSAVPSQAQGDAEPFKAFYTITFVNQGGPWKAVAMHSSRQ